MTRSASAQVESTLLLLKIAFLVLLYLFIWRIVRSAARDLRLPQESMILGPQQAAAAGLVPQPVGARARPLVVLTSPALLEGDVVSLDAHPLTVGRAGNNDVPLAGGRVRLGPPRALRAAARRRLRRGHRLDERHVRQRHPPDPRPATHAGRRRARRRDRSEVRAVSSHRQHEVRTDPGRKRHHNEDSYVFQPPLFAIADGMGGARAGEVASALAADALNEAGGDGGGTKRIVVQLIQEANRRVHERASTDAETSGMGTTITVALVEDDGSVTFGHVGDSRAYLLRDDRPGAADRRPLARRRAGPPRRAVGGGGRGAPAALGDHARTRHGSRRRRRRVLGRRRGRRPVSHLLGRAVGHGRRGRRSRRSCGSTATTSTRRRAAWCTRRTARVATTTSRRSSSSSTEAPVAAGEPDERTREYATEPDEEDTLHPEDGVAAITIAEAEAAAETRGNVSPAGRARQAAPGARGDRGAHRRHRRARLVGARALTGLSYRNRELLFLIVVGVLTGIGFASVYIARQSLVSWGSLSYALFFFGLYLAAHSSRARPSRTPTRICCRWPACSPRSA